MSMSIKYLVKQQWLKSSLEIDEMIVINKKVLIVPGDRKIGKVFAR